MLAVTDVSHGEHGSGYAGLVPRVLTSSLFAHHSTRIDPKIMEMVPSFRVMHVLFFSMVFPTLSDALNNGVARTPPSKLRHASTPG